MFCKSDSWLSDTEGGGLNSSNVVYLHIFSSLPQSVKPRLLPSDRGGNPDSPRPNREASGNLGVMLEDTWGLGSACLASCFSSDQLFLIRHQAPSAEVRRRCEPPLRFAPSAGASEHRQENHDK